MKWKLTIENYVVERAEGKRPNGQAYIPLTSPKALVIHTTEGTTVDGAVRTLRSKYAAPHFVVGENRIIQMRPLDAEAATLRNHNDVGWQVEVVGHSKQGVHKLTPSSWAPLVSLVRFFHKELGVPLARPAGWKDDLSDISTILASDNTRRKSRKALGFRGLIGHLEVPDQSPTWHWDPGALNYTALFREVSEEDDDVAFTEWIAGWTAHEQGKPKPESAGWERRGWADRAGVYRQVASEVPPHVHAVPDHKHTSGGVKRDGPAG